MDKKSSIFRFFIRSSEAGHFLENFFVASISTILAIRFFLSLTNYPEVGGNGLHIAHMLWGGFLMLAALIVLLAFLNKEAKVFGAVVGGIGFGAFIDELGKFVTADNNYFFKPTIALIYVVFVILFLLLRTFERNKKLTSREYIINALEATKELVVHDMDEQERKQALRFLNHADENEPVVKMLKELFEKIKNLPDEEPSVFSKFRRKLHRIYLSLVENDWFIRLIIGFFIVSSFYAFIRVLVVISLPSSKNFAEWGFIVSSGLASFFVIIGIYLNSRSRIAAYHMFKRSVLISIFLTQFFLFIEDQFTAFIGLGFDLLILLTLNYLIVEEKDSDKD